MGFIERMEHRAADDPAIYARVGGQIKRAADRLRAQRDGSTPPQSSRPPTAAAAPAPTRYIRPPRSARN